MKEEWGLVHSHTSNGQNPMKNFNMVYIFKPGDKIRFI